MKRIVLALLLAGCSPLVRQGRTDICATDPNSKDGHDYVIWQDVTVSDPENCYIVPFPEHIAQPQEKTSLTMMVRCKKPVRECHDCAH